MDDAVSNALGARMHGSEGLTKMLLASALAHAMLMTLAVMAPASFWLRPSSARPATVTIDLGPSAPGKDSGGLTSMGVNPVQRAVADPPRTRPTPPPAAKTPASVLPVPEVTPRVTTKAPPILNDAPKDARGRTPAEGAELRAGDTPSPTDAESRSIGLSTREGGGSGQQLNVGDFCCPEYLGTLLRRVRQNWSAGRGTNAVTTMAFTIQRDGAITNVHMVRSSGNQMLDFLAGRALLAVGQLPPLPDAYTNPSLEISLEFQYQR